MIKYALVGENAKAPTIEEESVGYDVYAYGPHIINPGETKIVPLGFHAVLPVGHGAFIWDRSSFGAKGIHVYRQLIINQADVEEAFRLHTLGGVIDWSYRGQWGVILHNLRKEFYAINHGDKIAQFVVLECKHFALEEMGMDALLAIESKRGMKGLGCSDGQNTAESAQKIIAEGKPNWLPEGKKGDGEKK